MWTWVNHAPTRKEGIRVIPNPQQQYRLRYTKSRTLISKEVFTAAADDDDEFLLPSKEEDKKVDLWSRSGCRRESSSACSCCCCSSWPLQPCCSSSSFHKKDEEDAGSIAVNKPSHPAPVSVSVVVLAWKRINEESRRVREAWIRGQATNK